MPLKIVGRGEDTGQCASRGPAFWGQPTDHPGAVKLIKHLVDVGVNLIDTADSYGPYISEEIIAEALAP